MAEIKDVSDSIAEVYAKSLIDLAAEKGLADQVEQEFAGLIDYMCEDSDFAAFMTSPSVDDTDRRQSLDRIFAGRINEFLLGTLQVLNNRGRSDLVAAVYERYHHLLSEMRGRLEVFVISAVPLTDQLQTQVQQQLSAYTGKQAVLLLDVDPDIIGGLVIRVGDLQIDASVRRRIQDLRDAFSRRATKEILQGREYTLPEA